MAAPIKSVITRFKNRLLEDLAEIKLGMLPEEEDVDFLRRCVALRRNVESSLAKLEAKNMEYAQFLRTLKGDERQVEEERYQSFAEDEQGFLQALVDATDALDNLNGTIIELEKTQDSEGEGQRDTGGWVPSNVIKLPKYSLPIFGGNPLDFQGWWDNILAAVDSQPISKVQKFGYVKGSLKGQALQAIEGLALTDANYEEAKEILLKRFGDKEVIKRALYTELRKIPCCANHTVDLREFYVKVDRVCRQLRTQKEDVDQSSLLMMIEEKLPVAVLIELKRRKPVVGKWKLNDLLKELEDYVSVREEAYDVTLGAHSREEKSERKHTDKGEGAGEKTHRKSSFITAHVSVEEGGERKNRYPCSFCGDKHFNDECAAYKTVNQRKDRAAALRLCFKCLRTGHRRGECKYEKHCHYCKGAHHNRAMCPHRFLENYQEKTGEPLSSNQGTIKPGGNQSQLSENEPSKSSDKGQQKQLTDASAKQGAVSVNVIALAQHDGRGEERVLTQAEKQTGSEERAFSQAQHEKRHEGEVLAQAAHEGSNEVKGEQVKQGRRKPVLLLTTNVTVMDPSEEKPRGLEVCVFMDSGSERSFVTESLAAKLHLKPVLQETLTVYTFASQRPKQVESGLYEIALQLKDGRAKVIQANSVPKLTMNLRRKASGNTSVESEYEWATVDLLVGTDYFWEFFKKSQVVPRRDGFYQIVTDLGTFITGGGFKRPLGESNDQVVAAEILLPESEQTPIGLKPAERNVETFWNLESIGVYDSPIEIDDDRVLRHFEQTVRLVDGRYEVQWPWKKEPPDLANNFGLCLGRLKSLLRRLQETPGLLEKYDVVIKDQVAQGIMEEVKELGGGSCVNYLPHQAVIKMDKTTTKVRVVYDASAKSNKAQKSLNEAIHRGPVLLPDLCGLQLRARSHRYLVVADVEKAFLQISLNPKDRDSTRFFWLRDWTKGYSQENLVVYRFRRIAFGVIASPFLLGAVLKYHLSKYATLTSQENRQSKYYAQQIKDNIYVDNILVGVTHEQQAVDFYKAAMEIFASAGMNLREWMSNLSTFASRIPEEGRMEMKPLVKLLGLQWKVRSDELVCTISSNEREMGWTKRRVLNQLAANYDPLGFLSPILVVGKAFFQGLCKQGLRWDEQLSSEELSKWERLMVEWSRSPTFEIARVVEALQGRATEIHVFTDASQMAYAAVVYLRGKVGGEWKANLVFAKSRLNPSKQITIPRLELLAVLIGVRALRFVSKELRLSTARKFLWSDSQCVLSWISSTKALPVFVENRLSEIRQTQGVEFRHIDGKMNPADLPTRGCSPIELKNNSLWWSGPEWLSSEEDRWPRSFRVTAEELEALENPLGDCTVLTATATREKEFFAQDYALSCPSWLHLRKVAVIVLRFLKKRIWNRLTEKTRETAKEKFTLVRTMQDKGKITAEEIIVAEKGIVKSLQAAQFPDVIKSLQKGKKDEWVTKLGIRDDDGILRCYGRYERSTLEPVTRAPVLLPNRNPVTKLIVEATHRILLHGGTQSTLAETRRLWWIPKGRKEVKKVVSACRWCKRFRAPPYRLPPMAPLPRFRTQRFRPFQLSGVDYFGPIVVRLDGKKIKTWTSLFTCLTVRAVHLEVVTDLTTEKFLNCFRRFVARRGVPSMICSDNATTFKGADRVIQSLWKEVQEDPQCCEYILNNNIRWHFITPLSPWKGGYYERMVGTVKSSLRRAVGRRILSLEEYQTMICEVEGVVNTRPLTYLYAEAGTKILRPVDFLLPEVHLTMPSRNDSGNDEPYVPRAERSEMVDTYHRSTQALDGFWHLWKSEYLLSLREQHRMQHSQPKNATPLAPKIGEVVLIEQDGEPRASWKLGIIERLIGDFDGKIRSAVLRTAENPEVERSINQLYPLEIGSGDGEQNEYPASEAPGETVAELESVASTQEQPNSTEQAPLKQQRTKPSEACAKQERIREPSRESKQEVGKETNYRNLRSKNRVPAVQNYSFVLFCMTMLAVCFSRVATLSSKCVANARLRLVDSQSCVSDGIVVMQDDENEYCWINKICPNQHLRDGVCKQKCRCPDWATDCSFYKGTVPGTTGVEREILETAFPGQVCSLKKEKFCDPRPEKSNFYQVELYSGAQFLVESLHLTHVQVMGEGFKCVGSGNATGTSGFCESHECQPGGKKFCFYENNEVVFLINQKGKVPVRAWGSVGKIYYGHRKQKSTHCKNCTAVCKRGGVYVALTEKISFLEVCAEPFCVTKGSPSGDEMILLPKEVVMTEYEVVVKIWHEGIIVKSFAFDCGAAPLCEMIDCYFCKEAIFNPQCASKWEVLVSILVAYLFCFFLFMCVSIIKCLGKPLRLLGKCCRKLLRYLTACCPTRRRETLPEREGLLQEFGRRRFKRPFSHRAARTGFTVMAVLALTFVTEAFGCVEVASLNAEVHHCSEGKHGGIECAVSGALRLALSPQGQKMCILIKNQEESPIGSVTIRVNRVGLVCQKQTSYYTRSYVMRTASAKRCARAGSCIGDKCAAVATDTKLEEFAGEANNNLGLSYCEESCGCAGCGCFFCSSACMFYRTYAVPSSSTVYEVFSCPTWSVHVPVTLEIDKQNERITEEVVLQEGVMVPVRNLKLTLVSTSMPPLPVLGKNFISDDQRAAMIAASPAGVQLAGTIGALQCKTREKAKEMNCSLPHGTCQCINGELSVACSCYNHELEPIMRNSEMALPLSIPGLVLERVENNVEARISAKASLELQVEIEGLKLTTKREVNSCKLTVVSFGGCYNCLTGARLKYKCVTDFGSAMAHVRCGKTLFTVSCGQPGIEDVVVLAFARPNVDVQCEVQCPASRSELHLQGVLSFVEFSEMVQSSNMIVRSKEFGSFFDVDFSFWILGLPTPYKILLGVGALSFFLLLAMYRALKLRFFCLF